MSNSVCLACNEEVEKITKDHVVPRVVLRDMMSLARYARFCATARKRNIQPLCAPCNGKKANRVIDYREQYRSDELRSLLKNWNLKVKFEDPAEAVL